MAAVEAPRGADPAISTTPQQLTIAFTSRNLQGEVQVTLRPNRDANHAHGLDLIFPSVPRSDFPVQFFDFPVLHGQIAYPTPATQLSYGCLFGWFQFVRNIKPENALSEDAKYGGWEMDIYPYAKDLQTPVIYWGFNPTIFDAPATLMEDGKNIERREWRAQSFLGILEDAGMSKRVKLVPGVGFGWGYDIHVGDGGKGRSITIEGLKILDAETEWSARMGLLRASYPRWTFLD